MDTATSLKMRPDSSGRFGKYGGKYVPETLIPALLELEKEYAAAQQDQAFQVFNPSVVSDFAWP